MLQNTSQRSCLEEAATEEMDSVHTIKYMNSSIKVNNFCDNVFCLNLLILVQNVMSQMVMTSVSGHLLGMDFNEQFRKWFSCNPVQLFDLPVEKSCREDNMVNIKRTLEREVRGARLLIIWTDCDREGEIINHFSPSFMSRGKDTHWRCWSYSGLCILILHLFLHLHITSHCMMRYNLVKEKW